MHALTKCAESCVFSFAYTHACMLASIEWSRPPMGLDFALRTVFIFAENFERGGKSSMRRRQGQKYSRAYRRRQCRNGEDRATGRATSRSKIVQLMTLQLLTLL
eukprot:97792-Pleurochrysis_carterae.AAC.2